MLTQELLKSLLDYNPETGILYWKINRGYKAKAGTIAGSIAKNGYRYITICGKNYIAHRIIYFYQTGKWPIKHLDHKNLKRSYNVWANIRDATQQQNTFNQPIRKNNTSGYKGVSLRKSTGKYESSIMLGGKHIHLGYFITKELASNAYNLAAIKYFGDFAKLN